MLVAWGDEVAEAARWAAGIEQVNECITDSTSEQIRAGQDRARAQGKHIGRRPAMTPSRSGGP